MEPGRQQSKKKQYMVFELSSRLHENPFTANILMLVSVPKQFQHDHRATIYRRNSRVPYIGILVMKMDSDNGAVSWEDTEHTSAPTIKSSVENP
jgi:hypothetical protein